MSIIAADPPWRFSDSLDGTRGAESNYKNVLSLEDICSFPIPDVGNDAYLAMWRVSAMVEEAYQVVRAWGFVPKSEIVWQKLTKNGKPWFGMGHHVRASHETAIIAVRGKPERLSASVRSTFEAPVPVDANGEYVHSAKPELFYDLLEQLAPGPYFELFARRRRVHWHCFGNQLPVTVFARG